MAVAVAPNQGNMLGIPVPPQPACPIHKIVDYSVSNDGTEYYKVKWNPTWEKAETLAKFSKFIDDFWKFVNDAKKLDTSNPQPASISHQPATSAGSLPNSSAPQVAPVQSNIGSSLHVIDSDEDDSGDASTHVQTQQAPQPVPFPQHQGNLPIKLEHNISSVQNHTSLPQMSQFFTQPPPFTSQNMVTGMQSAQMASMMIGQPPFPPFVLGNPLKADPTQIPPLSAYHQQMQQQLLAASGFTNPMMQQGLPSPGGGGSNGGKGGRGRGGGRGGGASPAPKRKPSGSQPSPAKQVKGEGGLGVKIERDAVMSPDFNSDELNSQNWKDYFEKIERIVDGNPVEVSYKCKVCGTAIAQASNCNRHFKKHVHATGEYKCPICQKEFHRQDYVERHLKTHASGNSADETAKMIDLIKTGMKKS